MKNRDEEGGFLHGVLYALSIMHANGQQSYWDDMVREVGYSQLRKLSRANDGLDVDGFTEYGPHYQAQLRHERWHARRRAAKTDQLPTPNRADRE